ncbi:MAG TPA: acyl carrier protein [Bacteroidales bacterium]|nr:acyl carrier protein [Bacteroidales bacterium]HPS17654.1 acyl carrier protein [Bacteroidales bacterium]
MEEFLKKLADILEVEKVEMNNVLTDFDEWDSLTSLSIIATIDADFNVNISAEQLVSVSTVGDLINLINEKIKR